MWRKGYRWSKVSAVGNHLCGKNFFSSGGQLSAGGFFKSVRLYRLKNHERKTKVKRTSISAIQAMEILDSRGNPTVRVYVELSDGTTSVASVPSGASTGENEAIELRDGDASRYAGKGVLKAVANVNETLAPALIGMDACRQPLIDRHMIELDGTANKSNLGANAILGVSMAVARAGAMATGLPLYQYLGGVGARRLTVPCMNILNGGEHADNNVDIQEFMAVPLGAPTFREGLRYVAETFHILKKILQKRGLATSVGDEGGFAPNLDSNEDALETIIQAIEQAGYKPGEDIAIALDSAANSFAVDLRGPYDLKWSGAGKMQSSDLINLAEDWLAKYPIILWEDPLAEGDWDGFRQFTDRLGGKIEVVGDDLFVTNTQYIRRGIEEGAANAALIKLNQIGTVSESIEAVRMCRDAGWRYFISHRSGETEDSFLADFAVAMDGGHLKTGSASRSERIAKYNRLLEIEQELGEAALYYWQ
ncbi:MAG: phosphopyruvate hydratase [Deltaproteobacteria bacterium]|nr:phosphopyruvate hydratase [Deltaproteobacteria bacterium]